MEKKIDAQALPLVLAVSVLMLLGIMTAWSGVDLLSRSNRRYHSQRQREADLVSALALMHRDSTARDSVRVPSGKSLRVCRERWGLYEILLAECPDRTSMELCGAAEEHPVRAALWLADHNRPLALSGNACLEGPVYVTMSGINYVEREGKYFSGLAVPDSSRYLSASRLPEVDTRAVARLDSLWAMADRSIDIRNHPGGYCSFKEETIWVNAFRCTPSGRLFGHAVLFGEKVILGPELDARDVLILAESVQVKRGFRGPCQIICKDSVTVESGAHLSFPSGVLVQKGGIVLKRDAIVEGYVAVLSGEGTMDKPALVTYKDSRIAGLVYVSGPAELHGEVSGAAYLDDCLAGRKPSPSPGAMHDVRIVRADSLAFPLLMRGRFTRKRIKKVH